MRTTGTSSQNQNQPTARQSLKAIAAEGSEFKRQLGGARGFASSAQTLRAAEAQAHGQLSKLDELMATRLSDRPPSPTIMRSLRSGALLAAASTTRIAALVAATGVGVVEAVANVVYSPIAGCTSGTVNGCIAGASMPVSYAAPVTAAIGGGVGAVVGTAGGVVSGVSNLPAPAIMPWSYARRTFRLVDQYASARAHTKRKTMSESQIAQKAREDLLETLHGVSGSGMHQGFSSV